MSPFKYFITIMFVLLLLSACTTLEIGVERTPDRGSATTEAASAAARIASSPTVQPTRMATMGLADTPASAPESTEIPVSPLTPTPVPPYLMPTPISAGQMRGEWHLITSAEGLCTDTPLFIGSDFIGTGTTKMCYFTDHWVTVEVPQGSRVTAANRFPPGGGWSVATDVGICHFPFGEWKCQTTAEGFPYAEIKSLIPLGSEAVYMLIDTVVFRSEMYRIPDIVGDGSARPTWISVSSEFFGGYFLTPEIWIGTNGYGVVVVQPATGNIEHYTTADGLPSNTIRDVEAEKCSKVCNFRDVWVATDGGVGHWDGTRWTTYTTADGLPSNDVRGVAPVQRNVVWVATASGAAYFDGQVWQAFTLADGLPVEDLQGVIWRQHSVWFNTLGHGLVTFTQQQQSQLPGAITARSSLPSPLPTPILTPAPTLEANRKVRGYGNFPTLPVFAAASDGKTLALYLVAGDTATQRLILEGLNWMSDGLTFRSSPDGQHLAFFANCGTKDTPLKVISLSSVESHLIGEGAGRLNPQDKDGASECLTSLAWLDNTHLLYTKTAWPKWTEAEWEMNHRLKLPLPYQTEIWLSTLDGTEQRLLAKAPIHRVLGSSSDGRTLSVTRLIPGYEEWRREGFALLHLETGQVENVWPVEEQAQPYYYDIEMVAMPNGISRVGLLYLEQGLGTSMATSLQTIQIGDPDNRRLETSWTVAHSIDTVKGSTIYAAPRAILGSPDSNQEFIYNADGIWKVDLANRVEKRLIGGNLEMLAWTSQGIVIADNSRGLLQLMDETGAIQGEIGLEHIFSD